MQERGSTEVDALEATGVASEATLRPSVSQASAPTLLGESGREAGREAGREVLDDVAIGDAVGRYKITGRIGAGGMGVVFRAYDPQLDREVALKLLLAGGSDGTQGRSRLKREAQAAAKIRHPNVVTVYDTGEEGGRVFIAMELIAGMTLKAWLRKPGRTWQDVLRVMLSAGEGLAAAHEVGLVHRDFKPDNVLIGPDGRAHVLDFGLARPAFEAIQANEATPPLAGSISRETLLQTLTQTGMTIGTPAYMAPEQHLAHPTSARSDQFSFAVVTYEALFGQRPFFGANYAELSLAVIEGRMIPPPRRSKVPPPVWQTLRRALHPNPEARFTGLAELLAELAQELRPGGLGRRVGLAAALLCLPLIAVLGAMALESDEDPDPPVASEIREERPAVAPPPSSPPVETPPSAEPGVELMTTRSMELGLIRALLDPVLPDKAVRMETREGRLVLVGAEARRWKTAIDQMLQSLDEVGEKTELFAPIRMPDGRSWSGFKLGSEGFERRAAALDRLSGVEKVEGSKGLGVILVRGPLSAYEAVSRALKKAADPAASPGKQRWCFVQGALPKECADTLKECEINAFLWLEGTEADLPARKKWGQKHCDVEK